MKKHQKNSKNIFGYKKTTIVATLIIIILVVISISYRKLNNSTLESITPTFEPSVSPATDITANIPSPTVSSQVPSEFTLLQLTPIQRSCSAGLSFYENDQFSICYPSGFFAYADTGVVGGANGQPQQNVVTFSSNKNPYAGESFWVVPVEEAAGGGQCRTYEKLSISDYPAQRETQRDILQNGKCGGITSILTKINTGQYYPFGIHYDAGNNPKFTQYYPIFEQSLKIKHP